MANTTEIQRPIGNNANIKVRQTSGPNTGSKKIAMKIPANGNIAINTSGEKTRIKLRVRRRTRIRRV